MKNIDNFFKKYRNVYLVRKIVRLTRELVCAYNEKNREEGENEMLRAKKSICVVIACILVGAVAIVFGIKKGLFLSKQNQILLATVHTLEQSQFVSNLDMETILKSDYTANAQATINKVSVTASYAKKGEQKSLTTNIGVSLIDDKIKADFLLDGDVLKIQVPSVGTDIFSYSYQEEKTGCLNNLFSENTTEKIDDVLKVLSAQDTKGDAQNGKKLFGEVFLKEFRNLSFSRADAQMFEVNGKEQKCKAYQTQVTGDVMEHFWSQIAELYKGEAKADVNAFLPDTLLEKIKENTNVVGNSACTFFLGDDQLAAVQVQTKDAVYTLELHGTDESGTEEFCIKEADETLYDLKYQDTDGSFKLKDGQYHAKKVTGVFSKEGDVVNLSVSEFQWNRLSGALKVSLQEGADESQFLQGDAAYNLNTMTDKEFRRIFWKLLWIKGDANEN